MSKNKYILMKIEILTPRVAKYIDILVFQNLKK